MTGNLSISPPNSSREYSPNSSRAYNPLDPNGDGGLRTPQGHIHIHRSRFQDRVDSNRLNFGEGPTPGSDGPFPEVSRAQIEGPDVSGGQPLKTVSNKEAQRLLKRMGYTLSSLNAGSIQLNTGASKAPQQDSTIINQEATGHKTSEKTPALHKHIRS